MSKQVCVLLADGFEESEAVIPVDLLRRGGVEVILAGVETMAVRGGHGIVVTADALLSDVALEGVDMVFVPGGLGGVNHLLDSPCARDFLARAAAADKYLAAICAGPTVLSRLRGAAAPGGPCPRPADPPGRKAAHRRGRRQRL